MKSRNDSITTVVIRGHAKLTFSYKRSQVRTQTRTDTHTYTQTPKHAHEPAHARMHSQPHIHTHKTRTLTSMSSQISTPVFSLLHFLLSVFPLLGLTVTMSLKVIVCFHTCYGAFLTLYICVHALLDAFFIGCIYGSIA